MLHITQLELVSASNYIISAIFVFIDKCHCHPDFTHSVVTYNNCGKN